MSSSQRNIITGHNMELHENIHRIKQMMGVITEDRPPIHILRRLPIVKKLLDVTLENSYPCDFDNVKHFIDGILYDIDTFLIGYETDRMSSGEIKEFVLEHLSDDIERYYYDSKEDC
jgi:hypothetical protein